MSGGIEAGKLTRRVEVFKLVTAQDSTGEEVKSLIFDFFLWAAPKPVRGKEQSDFGREESAQMLYTFKVRFDKRLSTTHAIKMDGVYWNIQSLAPMGRMNREVIEVLAQQLDVSKIVLP